MFKLERDFTKRNLTPKQRFEARVEQSKPISDAFFAWANNLGALPKSPLGKATGYALNQRKFLENVFLDGNLELSNNRCERSVKPFVMGRKAWLFSNTPDGAEASSVMYSIIMDFHAEYPHLKNTSINIHEMDANAEIPGKILINEF